MNDRIALLDVNSQRVRTHILGCQIISSPTGLRQVECIHWSLVRKRSPFTVTWETLDAEMEDGRWPWRLTALRYKAFSLSPNCDMNIYFMILVCRKLSTTILISGATKIHTTFQEGELGLIHKRLSCRATGKHPSPRSASVWSSATR